MNIQEVNNKLSASTAKWNAAENHITKLDENSRRRLLGAVMPAGYQPPVASAAKRAALVNLHSLSIGEITKETL